MPWAKKEKEMFKKSVEELKSLKTLVVVAMLIAISTVLSFYTIQPAPWLKINFCFLPIATIGMLGGPILGLLSGMICDVTDFLVHPNGPFLPLYTLIGGLQGLIYGLILYHKNDKYNILLKNNFSEKTTNITLYLRAFIARLIDVLLINLYCNTQANIYYEFIPKEATSEVVLIRVAKNAVELFADIPLMFILLPAILLAHKKIFLRRAV
ncbi:hypothetical protein FACS1894132_07800 [Clostridia bacterium]|nr:hypothetical protein FACS1894132_07800 [Clostridia bacterium]